MSALLLRGNRRELDASTGVSPYSGEDHGVDNTVPSTERRASMKLSQERGAVVINTFSL